MANVPHDEAAAGRRPSRIVVAGASAGGVEALTTFVSAMPPSLNVSLLIVLHVAPHAPSVLPRILARHTTWPVKHGVDRDRIEVGHIYVAPPDHHLVVHGERLRVVRAPAESGHRPAIDPLFRSAAQWWGKQAIGAVLSGSLDDGSSGLRAIVDHGGTAFVQDPNEAAVPDMPRNALRSTPHAEVLPVQKLVDRIAELTEERVQPLALEFDKTLASETELVEEGPRAAWSLIAGTPAGFTCPSCHGPLFETNDIGPVRFRCRIGHSWSADALLADHAVAADAALWTAVRILEDDLALQRRLATRTRAAGHHAATERIERRCTEREQALALLRQIVERIETVADSGVDF